MKVSNALVEAIPIASLLIGGDGRIGAANSTARSLFGELIEGRHYITVLRQPGILDAVEATLGKRTTTTAQYLTSQARRDVTLFATCTPVGGGGDVLLCIEDRTLMEEAGQMRRDFVANVSHELRTPLTALLGFIETLRGTARDDPAARDRFLGIMEKEAGRMNRLVGDLLSLSRVEAEERVRPNAEVDLARVVSAVAATLAPLASETGATVTLQGLDSPAILPGDADQLAQVVTNLVENAIKYSGKGARIEVTLRHVDTHPMIRGSALLLAVRDSGEGIEPLHIARLTERFYRIDSHRSREMGGTGLGLAIVKHIVNRHRGRLKIDSEPGKGSCFMVILPADKSFPPPQAALS